jgi:hypothetical protein
VAEARVRRRVHVPPDHASAVASLDESSKAAIPLQLVDLLTSAVAFEFRQNAGLAGQKSPKAELALYVRQQFNVTSFLKGVHTPKMNVKLYRWGTRLPASNPSRAR